MPGLRCCCAQAAISVSRKPSTTVSFTRNGWPSALVSTAATKGVLPGAPAPALAPAALTAEVGIVELDESAERMRAVALHHHLHQLVAHAPCGVVGDAELAVQLHRRCTLLVLGHEVDALEPHRQGSLVASKMVPAVMEVWRLQR